MSVPVLRSAHVCPVKSLAARACDTVAVEPWGLDGDRRWMLVDKAAKAVTQRQQPSLARIAAEPLPGGGVLLSAPGLPSLRVEGPVSGRMLTVELHRDTVVLEEAPGDAHDRLSAVLGTEVRLRGDRGLGGGRLAADRHRRGRLHGGQALRPLRGHDDRPAHR